MSQQNDLPRVLIVVQGGVVTCVAANIPLRFLIKDFDDIKETPGKHLVFEEVEVVTDKMLWDYISWDFADEKTKRGTFDFNSCNKFGVIQELDNTQPKQTTPRPDSNNRNFVNCWMTNAEADALRKLSVDADMSEENTIRQALRLLHLYRAKMKAGLKMAWQNPDGTLEKELISGCAGE